MSWLSPEWFQFYFDLEWFGSWSHVGLDLILVLVLFNPPFGNDIKYYILSAGLKMVVAATPDVNII